jgi:hypothetical protein
MPSKIKINIENEYEKETLNSITHKKDSKSQ